MAAAPPDAVDVYEEEVGMGREKVLPAAVGVGCSRPPPPPLADVVYDMRACKGGKPRRAGGSYEVGGGTG